MAEQYRSSDASSLSDEQILEECTRRFASRDFIMEPDIIGELQRYFRAGGSPEQVLDLLSRNYCGIAQLANLMKDALQIAGVEEDRVNGWIEDHLHAVVTKQFDPKKADSLFAKAGETPTWLTKMIEFKTWRKLIYRLIEEYPDCVFLNFAITLISNAGYHDEIAAVPSACQQLEVFTRVLTTLLNKMIDAPNDDEFRKHLHTMLKIGARSEHHYLFTQALLAFLSERSAERENEDAEVKLSGLFRCLAHELTAAAHVEGNEVASILMALSSGGVRYQKACQALSVMMSKNALNAADITQLFKMYSSNDPPPVDLIRVPQFVDMLLDALFTFESGGSAKMNAEHRSKYLHLAAHAASVSETRDSSGRIVSINKDELRSTFAALDTAQRLCSAAHHSLIEVLPEIETLFGCLKTPIAAAGILRFVENAVLQPDYFHRNQADPQAFHFIVLDEICTIQPALHGRSFKLLVRLFELPFADFDVFVQLEIKKLLIDRFIHLLVRRYVVPVVAYFHDAFILGKQDVSLIRYFVFETLELISPPYSTEFATRFLPLVSSRLVTGFGSALGYGAVHDPAGASKQGGAQPSVTNAQKSTLTGASSDGPVAISGIGSAERDAVRKFIEQCQKMNLSVPCYYI